MKHLITGLLMIFAHTAIAADKSGNFAIWGAGQKSCYNYSNARKSEDDSYYRYYLMGYLTAYNTQTPETYRISGNKNLSDILTWLDNYCESKQVVGFDHALGDFTAEHYPGRYKSSSAAGRR